MLSISFCDESHTIPIIFKSTSNVQYRNGDIKEMDVYIPTKTMEFEISSSIDHNWKPTHLGADDRHPRLVQKIKCSLEINGSKIKVERDEVEFQNGFILKIGHKSQAIVRFAVLFEKNGIFKFKLDGIWVNFN